MIKIILLILITYNIYVNYRDDTLKSIFWLICTMGLLFEYHINRIIDLI